MGRSVTGRSKGHEGMHRFGDERGWLCFYCGESVTCGVCFPTADRIATRDHFRPRSAGGQAANNLRLACYDCNQSKGDAVPAGLGAVVPADPEVGYRRRHEPLTRTIAEATKGPFWDSDQPFYASGEERLR